MILVTGGLGFIGSNFILDKIWNTNEHILNLDKVTYAAQPLDITNNKYTFVRGDICNFELVSHLVKSFPIEGIINFAAESHVDNSINNPEIFVDSNIKGTQVLLEVARQFNLRFHQVSTDEVYGSLGTSGVFTENSPINPSSPYSASKAAADHLVMSYHKTYGLHTSITRCSNNYGPRQHDEKLIPTVAKAARKDKPIPVYGNGTNVRDWIHVLDHCKAIDVVYKHGKPGCIYNVGANREFSNLEIVEKIIKAYGSKSQIEFVTDRAGHDFRYAISNTNIMNDLGWKPLVDFDSGLFETLIYYSDRYGKL